MEITYLADHPEFIPELAERLVAHWYSIVPELTLGARIAKLSAHLNRDVLPIAWVAFEGPVLYGTASLRTYDLEGREDLTPWLGGVFVVAEHRRKGIGAALCQVVDAKACAMGYPEIYLFSTDKQAWYRSLGWKHFESLIWRGHSGAIMHRRLTA